MIFDIIAVTILILGFLKGYKRGVIQAVFYLVSIYLGILLSLKFSYHFTTWLSGWLNINPKYLPIFSFAVLFIGIVIAVNFLSKLIVKALKVIRLNLFNRISGGIVYGTLGIFVLSTAIWFFVTSALIKEDQLDSSITWPVVQPVSPYLIEKSGLILPYLKDIHHKIDSISGGYAKTDSLAKGTLNDSL